MPVKWDDETEKKLLMAIIHVMGASAPTPNWNTVSSLMGPDYTAEGIRQKFTKGLKKQAANQFGEVQDGEGGGSKTPVKKGTAKKAASEKSGGKRKAKKGGSEDEDDVEETPSKKVKAEKDEVSDEGDIV